jgi:protein ImuA
MTTAPPLEALHPSLWRASQLARSHTRCIDTGHPSLSNQLPGGGWPVGTMVDLLVQQAGIGEMRLLAPVLAQVAKRQIAILQPPHAPQALALAAMGIPPSAALWLRADRTADALWAAEQVLRSGSCGALLFWQTQIRSDSLRRLHLAGAVRRDVVLHDAPDGSCARCFTGTATPGLASAGWRHPDRVREAPRPAA